MTGDKDSRRFDLLSIFFFFFVVVLELFDGSVGDNSAIGRERDDFVLFSFAMIYQRKLNKTFIYSNVNLHLTGSSGDGDRCFVRFLFAIIFCSLFSLFSSIISK
jgi:hypothetical protein